MITANAIGTTRLANSIIKEQIFGDRAMAKRFFSALNAVMREKSKLKIMRNFSLEHEEIRRSGGTGIRFSSILALIQAPQMQPVN